MNLPVTADSVVNLPVTTDSVVNLPVPGDRMFRKRRPGRVSQLSNIPIRSCDNGKNISF